MNQRALAWMVPLALAPGAWAQTPRLAVDFARLPTHAVRITLRIPGDADGSTLVGIPEIWGGIAASPGELHDLTPAGPSGEPCTLTPDGDHRWTVTHQPGGDFTLTYELRPEPREPLPLGHNDYRNVVRDDLFHAIGNHALVLPEAIKGPVEFEVSWSGFEGWTAASSLGPGPETRTITLPVDEFRSSFFIAGDPARLRLATRELAGNTVGIVLIDADWGFTDERFLDLVMQVVGAERDFFADHTDPWFLVALTPNGARAGERGFSFGGTGLANCFALFCNSGLDLSPGSEHTERIMHLLAHEYFHTWNGRKIRIEAPEGAAYWFSEGFTEFYARELLRRAGLWTEEQSLRSLNDSIAGYDRNPMRAVPNSRVVADFWLDRDVGDLPYRRGDLVALALDQAIRARSGGSESLDDFMRDLYARSALGEPPPTPEQLFALLAARAGDDLVARVRACVEHGEDTPLPETIEGGSLKLTTGRMRVSDDGFDIDASRAAGQIAGVRRGSGAHEAGLRDGQSLVSIERLPPISGPGRLKVVTRHSDGTQQTTVFEAVSEPKAVRRYAPPG